MRSIAHQVVVTGLGVVSPVGCCLEEFRDNLLSGKSGGREIACFDAKSLPTRIAAEVDDFVSPVDVPDKKVGFGVEAARSAMNDAEKESVPLSQFYNGSSGKLSFGIGLELFSMTDMIDYLKREACGEVLNECQKSALTYIQTPSDIVLHLICLEQHLTCAPVTHVSACSASTDAIGYAFEMIQAGRSTWMLAGGTDSMINPLGVGGFCQLMALSRRNEDPERASRPFDRDRDGFLLGEGAGVIVMETLENARNRGAHIYAEVVGYGNSFDAYGISEPQPDGEGAVLAMKRAAASANIAPTDIVHINAHGTATPKNDVVETRAIKKFLGDHAKRITVSSTKSMIGHLIAASGAVEVIALLSCAASGYVHPTINLENADPRCDLDYVPDRMRRAKAGYYLKNSFAFGGQNACLVFRIGDFI